MGAQRDRRRTDRRVDRERPLATMNSRNRSTTRSGKCRGSRTMLRTGPGGRPPRTCWGFGVLVASLWHPTTRPPRRELSGGVRVVGCQSRLGVRLVVGAGRTAVTPRKVVQR
jgi:hypothetical protein